MNEIGLARSVRRALRLEIPAEYGKRRARRLEAALDHENKMRILADLRCGELQEKLSQREEIIRELIIQSGTDNETIILLREEIANLQYSLDTAVTSAWFNENSVSFTFADRPMHGPEDYATAPIDREELRAVLEASEPLEGKITQLNPDTGRHDTVEIKRPIFVHIEQYGETDFMTPTYVPGMMTAS